LSFNEEGDAALPEEFTGFDTAEIPQLEAYRLLTACVAPRPIAFVSSVSQEGIRNLAPFSFFMAGGGNPPSVVVSPLLGRDLREKDTLANLRATGEYVINVVTYAMRERMNIASTEFAPEVDEWVESGFTAAPSVKVKPERVAVSPIALECRLFQIVPHGNGPMSANYIIGEVVYFHIASDLLTGSGIDCTRVDYISRLSADWYGRVTPESMFELARPPRP
jgi:flavin reductase (DIM6/NTAB) family NADH-FMN oxidoreductase RutF